MPAAEIPSNEAERLRALDEYEILDTPVDPEFDAVTALASSICGTPISVVNFIADGRQWFKSEVGLGVRETPLAPSICAHAILQDELFIVKDTTADPRFADNPLVTGVPGLRFYAGTLLKSRDGLPLGTLCVLDTEPRELDEQQIASLQLLGEHVRNMLELKRTNREYRAQTEQLKNALAGRQRVVATVAHDLRSPLSVIALGSKLIENPSTDPTIARTVAGRLTRAAGSMKRLVEDLLDIESQAGGELSVDLEPMSLKPLLQEMVELMSPLADEAGVRLVLDACPDIRVSGDRGRLHQVLSNLLGNALKFTPNEGRVSVGAEVDGDAVTVCVTDTGVGIPSEDRSAIFDPYVRVRSMNTHGAGLGLAICKRILEAHQGTIDVESEEGVGSSFCFSLPLL